MRFSGLALCGLLFAGSWAPGLAVSRQGRAGIATLRRLAGMRLRTEAGRLADALRWSLGGDLDDPVSPDVVRAARTRLGQEASRLATLGGPGAGLLQGYALAAPPVVLLLPPEDAARFSRGALRTPGAFALLPEGAEAAEEANDVEPLRAVASESHSTVFQSDGSGHAFTRTRHCKDGECEERVEAQQLPEPSPADAPEAAGLHESNLTRSAAPQEPLFQAVRSMAKEMWSAEQGFGRAGLEDMMRDMFASRQPSLGDVDAHAPAGNATGLGGGERAESISSSTEVVVRDGKMLKRTRRCTNGECTTSVTEGQLAGSEGGHGSNETDASSREVSGEMISMPL
mmetsp:Transcript_53166/g.167080  ORF Transcript_53166/g.167080 Transcript_53166/m.167080 type:complete len:342 (+) Transcript_53166:93-1118(+)